MYHTFMYHVSKLSLEDSFSNWVIPLKHLNVPVRICSYGNGMIDDVADRFGECSDICSFVRVQDMFLIMVKRLYYIEDHA